MRKALLIALACALLAACNPDPELQQTPKPPYFPDDRGVVTSISVEEIEIDGKRTYPISSFVQSFSTYKPKELRPVLLWKSRYVHVGLDAARTAIWIAGVGVVDNSVVPPIVFYANGELKSIDENNNLIFADGTVLKLQEGLESPNVGDRLTASIDASKDLVVKIAKQSAVQSP